MSQELFKSYETINGNKVSKIESSLSELSTKLGTPDNTPNLNNVNMTGVSTFEDFKSKIQATLTGRSFGDLVDIDLYKKMFETFLDTAMKPLWDTAVETGKDASAFFKEKKDDILLFFSDAPTEKELATRNFIDAIYGAKYSIVKVGSNWEVKDNSGNPNPPLSQKLNDLIQQYPADLPKILNVVIFERSLSGGGKDRKAVLDLHEILKEAGIDTTKEKVDSLNPQQLADAFVKYYSKTYTPNYTNVSSIPVGDLENFLKSTSPAIPPERKQLIRQVHSNEFTQNEDYTTGLIKKSLAEYNSIIGGNREELQTLAEEVAGKGANILNGGIEGVTKYMNGFEGLAIVGGLIYLLLFSEHKGKAWMTILGVMGANLASKVAHQDASKGIFSYISGELQNLSTGKAEIPELLKGIENESFANEPKNLQTIGILSRIPMATLVQNTSVGNNNKVIINTQTTFTDVERKLLEGIWGAEWKRETERVVTQIISHQGMVNKFDIDTKSNLNLEDTLQGLQNTYNFTGNGDKDSRVSLVLAQYILQNTSYAQAQISTQAGSPSGTNIPTAGPANNPNWKQTVNNVIRSSNFSGFINGVHANPFISSILNLSKDEADFKSRLTRALAGNTSRIAGDIKSKFGIL